ncbi:hypothetical protein GCM10017687_30330 [Streptomyces echinatus]|uniref:hypothetical protein n=1 Tax=Streptomyces echinatus TaxID=67293 RepID=UPI0031EE45C4
MTPRGAPTYGDTAAKQQLVVKRGQRRTTTSHAGESRRRRRPPGGEQHRPTQAAARTLKTKATIPDLLGRRPRTNKVIVTADSTVTAAKWDKLESTVQA